MAGYHDEYVAYSLKTVTELGMSRQVVRKFDSGEIANIFAVRDHRFQQVELDDAAEPNITARARKLKSQRRPPGTCADHGNGL